MKKYIALLALCLCQYTFATGPSHTTLKITPLSINKQGALLYRYKIITNPMGGHYFEDVLYGVGSFKDSEFTSLQEQVIHGDNSDVNIDYEKYNAEMNKLNQWLSSPCKPSDLMDNFISCNLEKYVVNRLMSGADLRQEYGVDITKATGYFLLPGKLQADEDAHIHVTYALNGLIVAEFKDCCEACEVEENHASVFIAQGSVDKFNNFDENDYGYDCANVTGIIVRK